MSYTGYDHIFNILNIPVSLVDECDINGVYGINVLYAIKVNGSTVYCWDSENEDFRYVLVNQNFVEGLPLEGKAAEQLDTILKRNGYPLMSDTVYFRVYGVDYYHDEEGHVEEITQEEYEVAI